MATRRSPLLPALSCAAVLLAPVPAHAGGLTQVVTQTVAGTAAKVPTAVAALPLPTGPLIPALLPTVPVAVGVSADAGASASVGSAGTTDASASASAGATAPAPSPGQTASAPASSGGSQAGSSAPTSAAGKNGSAATTPTAAVLTTVTTVAAALHPPVDPSCAEAPVSKPFSRWADRANYVIAPNGTFERGLKTWTKTGSVKTVDDNEPWFVTGSKDDDTATLLRPGSTLSSASFCGGLEYPTVRLFARSASSAPAVASITMRYVGSDGLLYGLPLGVVTAGKAWKPTLTSLTASGLPVLSGTRLGITITPITGSIVVDDIYVDPYRRS